ncbi:hypothetical protein AB0I81_40030 [Nonomuraea sp. NPDC050404]|uniref:hypothetical protein n=1 Tax=Nonomuraea sp. NPDC050404 TaxID=3155783 RepID=UPI0033F1B3F4
MTATHTADAITMMTAELALIGRTPTATDIEMTMRMGFRPVRYMILVDGQGYRFAVNRLAARIAARSAGRLHPDAVIEVEHRPTGERAVADVDGSFVHVEGVFHMSADDTAWSLANMRRRRT